MATLFLYGFQQFSLEGCVNMSMALSYLIYGASMIDRSPLVLILATMGGIVLACWARLLVVTLFASAEFWLLGSDATRFFHEFFHAASDRPLDVFGRRMRQFFLYLVLVGALTNIPASIVLGRYGALEIVLTCGWLFLLGLAVIALWNRGFRRYESAMG